MKKLALVLAMLLCVVPVLSACGANSSPEKAAETAFKATYVDFDYEAYYEVAYKLNLDLIEDVMEGSDKLDGMKEEARSERDSMKEMIKSMKDNAEDYEDYDIDYEVRYCISYDKDEDKFDEIMEDFGFADTDFVDLIDEVAVVGIAAEVYTTDEDGVEEVDGTYAKITCYNIDGDWYID